jgi:hypothetical protein
MVPLTSLRSQQQERERAPRCASLSKAREHSHTRERSASRIENPQAEAASLWLSHQLLSTAEANFKRHGA